MISHTITKIVGKIITNDNAFTPADPTKDAEVLSNIKEKSVSETENVGAAHIMKLSLFLINGNEK